MELVADLISFTKLCRELPGYLGAHPNPKVLRRWNREGLLAPDGKRITMPAKRIGGRWFSTRTALREFLAAVDGEGTVPAPLPLHRRELQRAVTEAEQRLDELGVNRPKKRIRA